MIRTKYFSCTVLSAMLLLSACDRGHSGKAFIRNTSSFPLQLNFRAHSGNESLLVQPNTMVEILKFGGLGEAFKYDCCPCEYTEITLQPLDPAKHLAKEITVKDNWSISNPNTNWFTSKLITCEFTVNEGDIH